ncbi:MAG: sensor domain-containing diguanylate cyclase [Planctomycetota bacterium]|nr:sensor domain-containing diguanylate cyclase [Planctomycetota bacterium]
MRIAGTFFRELADELYEGVYFLDRDRTITYWNGGAERISGFAADEVIGRRCAQGILMHVDERGRCLCRSRVCPAAKAMRDERPHEAELYIHHRDGHRVPVVARTAPVRDKRGRVVGAVEVFRERYSRTSLEERIRVLEEQAQLDELTSIGNRRYGQNQLQVSLNELRRTGLPCGVLMLDVDHFKDVNDRHGHVAGDRVLRLVANTLAVNVRSFDHVARWGGDEFLVILINVRRQSLRAAAEKLRALVASSRAAGPAGAIHVAVSIGATLCRKDDTPAAILGRADTLLYRSKKSGRDRVCM